MLREGRCSVCGRHMIVEVQDDDDLGYVTGVCHQCGERETLEGGGASFHMKQPIPGAMFNPGRIAITPAAVAVLDEAEQHVFEFLQRFVRGDWGHTASQHPQDAAHNDRAVHEEQARIVAGYETSTGRIICLVTYKYGGDGRTTCMLPEES